jgi:hypothetical protein
MDSTNIPASSEASVDLIQKPGVTGQNLPRGGAEVGGASKVAYEPGAIGFQAKSRKWL